MDRDSFKERERALEEGYFRAQDAKLIEQLRQDARLEEIVLALAEHLQVDNPELLRRVIALGVRLDTGPAFLLAPLVQVAWAEAKVTDRERDTVLRLAEARGVEAGSPAHTQLLKWLEERPSDVSSTRRWRSSEVDSPSSRQGNARSASSASCKPAMRWPRRPVVLPRSLAWGAVSLARRRQSLRPFPRRSGGTEGSKGRLEQSPACSRPAIHCAARHSRLLARNS